MNENSPDQQIYISQQNPPVKVVVENESVKAEIKKSKTRVISLGLILGWVLGLYALIWGLVNIFLYPSLGILSLISGVIVFPPITHLVKAKLNIEVTGCLKWFLYAVFQIIGGFIIISYILQGMTSK